MEGGGGDGERERRAGREEGEHDGEVAALDGDEQRGHRGPEPVHVEEHLQRESVWQREARGKRAEKERKKERKRERERESTATKSGTVHVSGFVPDSQTKREL